MRMHVCVRVGVSLTRGASSARPRAPCCRRRRSPCTNAHPVGIKINCDTYIFKCVINVISRGGGADRSRGRGGHGVPGGDGGVVAHVDGLRESPRRVVPACRRLHLKVECVCLCVSLCAFLCVTACVCGCMCRHRLWQPRRRELLAVPGLLLPERLELRLWRLDVVDSDLCGIAS